MIRLLVSVTILSIFAISTQADGMIGKPCLRNTDFYSHESKCDKYYHCDNHRLVLLQCYPGLHWNDGDKICDYPLIAQCPYFICDAQSPVPICPEPTRTNPSAFLAHQNDCSLYYQCEWGVAYLMECPEGLHFNPKSEKCQKPEEAGCDCYLERMKN